MLTGINAFISSIVNMLAVEENAPRMVKCEHGNYGSGEIMECADFA